jgi:hypothetical protein
VTYADATVTVGKTYSYRVKAVNAVGSSAYTNIVLNVSVPVFPAVPTGATVTAVAVVGTSNYAATLNWSYAPGNPASFTIQRATNVTFTKGLNVSTVAGLNRTTTQTVNNNTTYYYRIRANDVGGSSAWTNASPFPIRTGP